MIPNISQGSDFADLVNYLVENRDHELLNMQGVSSLEFAAEEMAAVAAFNHRAKNKLLHLSLSAAHEDGELGDDQWLTAVDRIEAAFGLTGHQRVVVRHRDTLHDHIHVFWCTISIDTGRTPPKRWFLKKGCAVENIGPRALIEGELGRVPAGHRALRTYDFRLLARSQYLCRQLERDMDLRQLRTPQQAAAARLAGEQKAPSADAQKRAERTGSVPLITRAAEIRDAIETPDWPSKRQALCAIGIDFEPVFRMTRTGVQLRGLVLFDRADPGNRIASSKLDTPTQKFGCRRLEDRHAPSAPTLETWWPERSALAPEVPTQSSTTSVLKEAFLRLQAEHILVERQKMHDRKKLRERQKNERKREQRALMRRRREEAAMLRPSERRAFYRDYSKEVRAPALAALAREHQVQAIPFARARKPKWIEFLAMCAATDPEADKQLRALKPAQKVRSLKERIQQVDIVPAVVPRTPKREAQPPQRQETQSPAGKLSPSELFAAFKDFQARGR